MNQALYLPLCQPSHPYPIYRLVQVPNRPEFEFCHLSWKGH